MAEMADASLAKRLFQKNDLDQNGVLDARELRTVVRELAAAFGVYLTNDQVNAEVAKCSANFGSAGGVTEDGFQRYAASEPAAFGALFLWREVFSRYASASDEIQEADAVKLVMDVCAVNKHAITPAMANAEAVELMKAADVQCTGSINFFEFVAYAREREALFGQLTQEVCTTPPPTPVPLPRPLHRALHISAALSHQVMKDVGGARKKPAAGAGVGSKAGGAATRSPRASGRRSEGRGGGGSSGGGGGVAGAVGAGAVGAAASCADGGGGCGPTGSVAAQSLLAAQADAFPSILKSLKKEGPNKWRKRGHWAWFAFPTTLQGANDCRGTAVKDEGDAALVLSNDETRDQWAQVLHGIANSVQAQRTRRVLPGADHGRVDYFLADWCEKYAELTPEWPDFHAALQHFAEAWKGMKR